MLIQEEVTLGSDVGGRGSSTSPQPKLCRSGGADPPADIEGNESGAPEDGMLTVTLKLHAIIIILYSRLCVLVYVYIAITLYKLNTTTCMQCFCDSSTIQYSNNTHQQEPNLHPVFQLLPLQRCL